MKYRIALLCLPLSALLAQEATSGIDLSATVSGNVTYSHDPADGVPAVGGLRAVLYPTWKMGEHWILSGAMQLESTPFFQGDTPTQKYSLQPRVLQASIGYSKVWNKGSVLLRAGELSSAFGSFLLRYDDAVNPLLGAPSEYGYYYAPVTTAALVGAQADVTSGKWDGRVELANSSPANPRSAFDRDQYPNWAGGAGFTLWQGFRIGVSAYRGPYLGRDYKFFSPTESRPRDLAATAVGADSEWAYGHWSLCGELQHFVMPYHVIPTFIQSAEYLEAKRVLQPRWYVAARAGYRHTSYNSGGDTYEVAVGFRASAQQLIKIGYALSRGSNGGGAYSTVAMQLVTTRHPFSKAWN